MAAYLSPKLHIWIEILNDWAVLFHFMVVHKSGILQSRKASIRIFPIYLNVNCTFMKYTTITVLVVMIPIKVKNRLSVFIYLCL